MDKGMFSEAAQTELIQKARELVKDQKPVVVLAVTLTIKAVFLYADDILAEKKLPVELTTKCRSFFDAIFVEKDVDKAMMLGLDLIPMLYELFKKPKPVTDATK